jgi:hypothetical protein
VIKGVGSPLTAAAAPGRKSTHKSTQLEGCGTVLKDRNRDR